MVSSALRSLLESRALFVEVQDLRSTLVDRPRRFRRAYVLARPRPGFVFGLGDQETQEPKSLTQVDQIKAILRNRTKSAANGRVVQRPFDDRISIRHGEEGTEDTIKEMARHAVLGSRDLIVRLIARDILEGIGGRDHEAIARRFFHWLQDRGSGERSGLKFQNDPWRTEQVRAPWYCLAVEGAGDCNSGHSTAMCALLMSVGVPCFFRTVKADPARKDQYSHVYSVAMIRGRPLALDTSVPFSSPGSEPSGIFGLRDWKIPVHVEDDWGRAAA
jgi:hypothetical protein